LLVRPGAYSREEHLKYAPLRQAPVLLKFTRAERLARDSLFTPFVSDEEKSFIIWTVGVIVMKTFSPLSLNTLVFVTGKPFSVV
jgi:hypothetical protein